MRRATLHVTITVGLLLSGVTAAEAQIVKDPPPSGSASHSTPVTLRYDNGGLDKVILGAGYRDVWSVPIEIPVLDLQATAGGLTPVETGGYGQTLTLEMLGADGLEYAVRSIDKDPTRRLDSLFIGTIVARTVQDQVGQFLPTAGLVVDPIMEATGILHPRHRLVVIPDDPALGEFRDAFAGLIGMFVDRPNEGRNGRPGFAGSERIVGTDRLVEILAEGACDRVDEREYLKARLIDMLIGDRDRHEGQWRWARFPAGNACHVWRPIPVDRDQAFIMNDGLMMSVVRWVRPQQVRFGSNYPSLVGLTYNGWEVDRQLLAELDAPVWLDVAEEIQRELGDEVIRDAVRRLPPAHYELRGAFLEEALIARRDALVEEAQDYFDLISQAPDIRLSDRSEEILVEHLTEGDVRVSVWSEETPSAAPRFERTFAHDVTDEIRIYAGGGDDRVEITGERSRIKIRVIGGPGDDSFANTSAAGAGDTRFYDDDGVKRVEGRARLDERTFEAPPATNLVHRNALDWGGLDRYLPQLSFDPDLGVTAGFVAGLQRYGFRKVPWKSDNEIRAAIASNGPEFLLGWEGRFRNVLWSADLTFDAEYSGLNVLRFYGFGNETTATESSSFFKVEQEEVRFSPGLAWSWGHMDREDSEIDLKLFRPAVTLGVGPVLQFSDTPFDENADRFIGQLDPVPLGVGSFGQVGGRVDLVVDTRDSGSYATRGVHVALGGSVFPALWDVDDAFGEVHGTAAAYLTPGGSSRAPTLALRVGGTNVFGTFPYHEAAYLGGGSDLRGYRTGRFAGDAAAYGNVELRLPLARFDFLFPSDLGVLAAADVGRVFFDGDRDGADGWHNSFGGGLWWSFLKRTQTISATVMRGDDLTAFYLQAGLHF